MSRLPNAPLLEVVFELRWDSTDPDILSKFQYLHGDLYAAIKKRYPFRENILPPTAPLPLLVNNPIYRFRSAEGAYPLVQLGPALLTLNTVDDKYFWDEYFGWCEELVSTFFEVYPHSKEDKFNCKLMYFDFFKFNFEKNNAIAFINDNLNIHLKQKFFDATSNPKTIQVGFNYETNFGQLDIFLNSGKNTKNEEGLILKTELAGSELMSDKEGIFNWLDKAHTFCSNLFKQMTHGSLYESFK